jgi:DNA-binding LacI/PurR family transcriptional regulator
MPSFREIAELAGVSKSTVSLVLNDKPGVSGAMRKRVLNAMKELQEREANIYLNGSSEVYAPKKEDLTVLVLHPATFRSSQVFSELLQGIQAGATRHRIQLSLAVNEPDLPEDHISRLYFTDPALRPDGILVIGSRQDYPLPKVIFEQDIPCVLVGRNTKEQNISSVGRDEEHISYKATRYLVNLGHEAIAFIGGNHAYNYTKSRLYGYKKALESAGIIPQDTWVAFGNGKLAAREILSFCPNISAAIFVNDDHAIQALPIFQSAGLKIPEDLSVISFDDTEFARNFTPSITSVAYSRYQEGLWSLTLLVNQIQNPLIKYSNIVFRATLIERESCAPPKHFSYKEHSPFNNQIQDRKEVKI